MPIEGATVQPTLNVGDEAVLAASAAVAEESDFHIGGDQILFRRSVPALFVVDVRQHTDIMPLRDAGNRCPPDPWF